MGIKVCRACKTTNAIGNHNCVRCGCSLSQQKIESDKKKVNFYFYMAKRYFSSLLVGCAVVSVVFALMAFFHSSGLTVLLFQ